jgi:uncharacterized SAM-binding protein YcdF (DUF218 family)
MAAAYPEGLRTAIVIPGHHTQRRSIALVREAERAAAERPVHLVVFTGWARSGGMTEAEQMRSEWRGPDVELVLEPTASVTAENAARTLPLLIERDIGHAIVVCAPLHLYRARFFFTRLYDPYGVETEFRVARMPLSVGAVVWEVAAATACRRQLRIAQSELAQVVR